MQWFCEHEWFKRDRERIEITVETKESWEIHWLRQSRAQMCRICQTETIFIPVDLGTQIVQTENRFVENLIADGKIHFRQSADNDRLICLASLKKEIEKNE